MCVYVYVYACVSSPPTPPVFSAEGEYNEGTEGEVEAAAKGKVLFDLGSGKCT